MGEEIKPGAETLPEQADQVLQDHGAGFDSKLLEVFACPITKLPLRYDREAQELISDRAGLAYPIRDGVAVLAPGEARKIGG